MRPKRSEGVCFCSFTQAAAAAQAGASVIQATIGRLKDWYTRHPGFPRDPRVRLPLFLCLMLSTPS